MKNKKDIDYYLNLPWTYTIETETYRDSTYYIIRVNELPGICTDAEDLNEGMKNIKEAIACAVEIYQEKGQKVPEPINKQEYKGKILYRTDNERHFLIAKIAKRQQKSISRTLDFIVDEGIKTLHLNP